MVAIKKSTKSQKKAGKRKRQYALRLYVTGVTQLSRRALANIKEICEKNFQGNYKLEIVDLYQQPELTQKQQIVASPTLIKSSPLPACRFVGDMSDTSKVLSKLKEH
jgi:circadian clock protein KaiB